ncbi:Hemin transporter [Sphingomonas antarctica]|uniref:ShlB/FhaC/HecB family hemolysin secretion/activation protein n=1 Tax=Sphingomonas antarctica TaxID=2040274 RepID=UPI0039EBE764
MALVPAMAGGAALAQSAPPVPTREEIQRIPVAPTAPPTGRVTVEGEIERAPCPLADPAYADVRVTLSQVEFNGLGPIDPAMLRPAYGDAIGKTLAIAEVCEIRDRAATILRRAGYLAAVQVPAQRIENGVVHFDVLLAKLVGIQVRGDAGASEGVIQRYLAAIQRQPVFNVIEAERYLLLARDLPGIDVRLALRPAGTVPGEVIGEARVVRVPIELDANFQNYGSHEVGRWGGTLQLRLNGLLGLGDRTTLGIFSTAQTREQQVLQAGEEIRIGGDGLTFGLDGNYAWTRPSLGPTFDLRSRTFTATARLRYPIIRRQNHDLYVAGGLDFINQTSRLSTLPLTRDRLRVAFARLDYDAVDPDSIASTRGYSSAEPRWRILGGVELRQGLGLLGASDGCGGAPFAACAGMVLPSRTEGDPTAFVGRISAVAEFRPIPRLTFSLQPRAQYAPHALFSYEEFSAGNYTVGRGFDPGTIIGDSGVGFRSEIAYGSLIPRSAKSFAVQGYGFFDAAWVWNKDSASNGLDPEKLQSAGGGVRVAFGDRFQVDGTAAVPLRRAGLQTRRGDTRFLLTLTTRLLPWR